jgi:hypothetical protein
LTGRVDELDAYGDDSEGFAFRWVDLADVGELFRAGCQRVDCVDLLMVEHVIEVGVSGDAGNTGEDFITFAAETG